MAANELKIYDEEFEQVQKTYQPKAATVEKLMAKYFKTVQSIVNEEILEGKTALALQNFNTMASQLLTSELGKILEQHQQAVAEFIEETAMQDDAEL